MSDATFVSGSKFHGSSSWILTVRDLWRLLERAPHRGVGPTTWILISISEAMRAQACAPSSLPAKSAFLAVSFSGRFGSPSGPSRSRPAVVQELQQHPHGRPYRRASRRGGSAGETFDRLLSQTRQAFTIGAVSSRPDRLAVAGGSPRIGARSHRAWRSARPPARSARRSSRILSACAEACRPAQSLGTGPPGRSGAGRILCAE